MGRVAKRVLLVDDEPMIIRVLRRFLEKHKYEVFEAGGRRAALEVFHKEKPFHVLLCDVHLGMDNGWRLAEEIYLAQPSIHVLMISGAINTRLTPDTLAYRMLYKPFTHTDLERELTGHWEDTS
jgi:DNA-binding NtrC family response regulator